MKPTIRSPNEVPFWHPHFCVRQLRHLQLLAAGAGARGVYPEGEQHAAGRARWALHDGAWNWRGGRGGMARSFSSPPTAETGFHEG